MEQITFKKGDRGFFIQNWDGKGSVAITPVVVSAAGKKEMTLIHAETGKKLGHRFQPGRIQNWRQAILIGAHEDVEAVAVSFAAGSLEEKRAGLSAALSSSHKYGSGSSAIQAEIESLHEVRLLNSEGGAR